MEDVRPETSTGNGAEGEPRLTGGWPRRKPKDNSTSGSPLLLARNAQRRPSPRAKMREMHVTQVPEGPWATVCADFVGPLQRSKHGNQTLLVLIDRFSKWRARL